MNITFQTITGQKMDGNPELSGMEATSGFKAMSGKAGGATGSVYAIELDASLYSNDAYGRQGKTAEDITKLAQNTDVMAQHNYMALLSNTLSGEDYAKALEEGFDIKNTDSSETVTIVDKIKSVLLESGVEITGYNDDLSVDKLSRITGSKSFAMAIVQSFHENDIPVTPENAKASKLAYDEVSGIEELEDGAVKYLVLNNLEPTIENIYRASHSSNGQNMSGRGFYAQDAGGYYAQKADTYDWEQLDPQIDKIIAETGIKNNEQDIKEIARWIVKQGIPLNPENLERATDIFSIHFPVSENEGVKAIAAALADGKRAGEASLADPESSFTKALKYKEMAESVTEDDIKAVIQSEETVNLRNLYEANKNTLTASINAIANSDSRFIEARLQLEQVRLQMTVEANRQLINSGFSIDTAPMEQLIERLKEYMGQMADYEAGEALDKITGVTPENKEYIFRASVTSIEVIKSGPVDITGAMLGKLQTATLSEISITSSRMASDFKKAGESYETMMTKPRTDLGDRISKAFRNVDELLKDLQVEATEENRRAVRILGYNSMEISKENFEAVRSWDQSLKTTLERLKPGAVLDLIREGRNPLGMTIEELSQSLNNNQMNSEDKGSGGQKSDEKYAKFLYKLEKKSEITPEEKASFIGIYRLFHTLKVNDYQAIGSVLKSGLDMTLGNLLTATRTQGTSRRGLDYTVDDDFGGLGTKGQQSGLKIDEQISSAFRYYSTKADIVYENLEPEKLLAAAPKDSTLLPDLASSLQDAGIDEQLEQEYYSQQVRQMREVASQKAADPALSELSALDMDVTFNNLEAMISNRRDRRTGNIWDKTADTRQDDIDAEQQRLVDALDEEDYPEIYQNSLRNISDKLSELLMTEDDTYIDVRSITLMQKQLSVMGSSSEKGSFDVPVEIDGQKISMHITLRSDKGMDSRMEASIQTYEFGLVTATLYEKNGIISGMLTTTNGQSTEETEYLESVRTKMCANLAEKLKDYGVGQDKISILYHAQIQPTSVGQVNATATDGNLKNTTETKVFLTMAKAFIEAL